MEQQAARTAKPLRVWLVGFGTVGQWLINAIRTQQHRLTERYGVDFAVVGVANARDGFIYHDQGLDLEAVVEFVRIGKPLSELPGVRCWASAIQGMRATEADVLVEVAATESEPGVTHMREALRRGIPVVTSNKWPVALHGVELAELAAARHIAFRAESTVMSGTPLLSALVDGLAGTTPITLRGLLNATVNVILTRMADGLSYAEALAEAKRAGLAERDPSADVEGHDSVAKVMILSALVFGRQLQRDQVLGRGITGITRQDIERAMSGGGRIKHIATLEFAGPDGTGKVSARVEPMIINGDDPLARIDGTTNAVVYQGNPVGEITIAGPGAGPQLAGQGVLSDLIAVARNLAN